MDDKTTQQPPVASETAQGERVLSFPVHTGRARALGEVHSRPAPLIRSPRLIIQLAFMTDGGSAADHAVLTSLARQAGAVAPERAARHHTIPMGAGMLRWERHTEFSTYLWEGPLDRNGNSGLASHPFGSAFSPPGTLISGVRVEIRKWTRAAEKLIALFDPESLCYSRVEGGKAAIATDFRQDGDGLTRVLVLDKGLTPARVGILSQRVVEIETYRTLAMLGLPLAHTLSPNLRRMEDKLAYVTAAMRREGKRDNAALLSDLAAVAAELEAEAASSGYRFGASRAYSGIVDERLRSLKEQPVEGHETWSAFLEKRMAPAMRTCRSVEERQETLSRKLTRSTQLLRSWVELQLQGQNSDLLASMNRRAKLQLRLQQTVEGLSVAAVSYYVVGLIGYIVKGFEDKLPISAAAIAAISVPFVILAVWLLVRRVRRGNRDG